MEDLYPALRDVFLNKDLLSLLVRKLSRLDQGRLWQVCRYLSRMKDQLLPRRDMDRIKVLVNFLKEKPPSKETLFGHAGSVEALRLVPKDWLWTVSELE